MRHNGYVYMLVWLFACPNGLGLTVLTILLSKQKKADGLLSHKETVMAILEVQKLR
jgi:hypothetical protein